MSRVLRQAGASEPVSLPRWKGSSRAESGPAGKRQAVLIGWLTSLLGGISPLAAPPVLLVGALGLFAPAPADAQTVWRGTFAPQNFYSNYYGCGFEDNTAGCQISSNLNPNTFTFNGKQWKVTRVTLQESSTKFSISVSFANQQLKRGDADAFSRLKLRIGDLVFDLETGDNAAYRMDQGLGFAGMEPKHQAGSIPALAYSLSFSKSRLQALSNAFKAAGGKFSVELYGLEASNPPAAPTNLRVQSPNTDLDSRLALAWTPPLGVVTGYDVHYTSMLNPNLVRDTQLVLNHPIRNNPAVGWVAVSRSGDTALQTISGLIPGTAYRVRVRAKNAAGTGGWVFGKGTTSGTTPSVTVSAPPAAGDVLVSNFSQRPYGSTFQAQNRAGGQAFTTGSAPIMLSSIDLAVAMSAHTDNLRVELWSATSGGVPNAKISDLVVPWGNIAAGTTVSFRAPANTRLEANTAYSIVAYRPEINVGIGFATVNSDNEDPGAAPGWSIANSFALANGHTPSGGFPTTGVSSLAIAVKGRPVPLTVSLSASPNPVEEGSPVTVTATLAYPLSEDVRIPLNTAMMPQNWETMGSYDIAIAAGETTGTQEFTAPQVEDGEMKQYQIAIDWWRMREPRPLSPKGSQSHAGVTVLNGNADPHRVSVSDAKGWEQLKYGRLCFEFTLNRAASHRIWVNYWTEDGTAVAGQDYRGVEPSNMAIVFAPGETSKRKCFGILDDNVEDSGETFYVVLANPHGAILGDARGTGTIHNHESTSLSALIVEGASGEDGPFTALDIGPFAPATTAYGVTVPHGTTHVRLRPKTSNSNLTITTGLDGKGKSPVSSGQAGPAVALAVGENVLVVKTEFNGQHQTYRVTVTRQAAAAAVAVSLSATPNPVGEGSPVTVTATLTAALLGDVTIPLSTRRDTSEEGDHGALAAITVPAGFTSATGTLPTFEDDDGEDETFTLALGSLPTGLTAGRASSVQVTITKQQSSGATTTDTSTTTSSSDTPTTSSSDTTTSSSGVSPTASGPDGETLLVGFGQIAQTPPEVSIALDGDGASTISEGEEARFRLTATPGPAAGESISVAVTVTDSGNFARSVKIDGRTIATIDEGRATFMVPMNNSGTADFSVATQDDEMDESNGSITATVRAGTGYTVSDNTAEVEVQDNDAPVAAPPTEEKRAWHVRFGRSVSQQVVDALQQRFSTTTPSGLQLTLAGEALTSDTPLQENHVLLSRLLGFERVSSQELAQGSSFSFSPDGAGAHLSFWGKGAFSSFNGIEESITLTGDVTTALVGAEWSNERWRAGAALSHSWGNGSHQGEGDAADGRISSSLTGIFPYGRYALTPRLGVWATAGYGWGNITLNPDGEGAEYNPATTLALGAVGMDGLLLDGGREGLTLTTTADALFLKTTSEAVVGLASSEGNITRLRLGLEASRAFPLANGASLSPSLEVGLRQDSGDAETGFGMDLGAGLSWNDPERGITATVKGRTLLSHGAEDFQDQGLALSFSWQPSSSNRGASLSLSHAVGLPAEGGLAALLNPTAIEVLDEHNSSGQRFETRLAYGFPFYNDRLTLSPAVAAALSPSSRTYGLLWSLAPHDEHLVGEPWELSLEGERHENLSSPTVDHSLKLRFALNL